MKRASLYAFCLLTCVLTNASSADDQATKWKSLAAHFQPPAELASDFGGYRSPLKFDDGTPVRNAEDWQKRRAEIRKAWHDFLGPWPAMVTQPKIEYMSKERRENFTQCHVRIQVAPDRFTDDAYLLIPDGDGPFPAAVVVYYDAKTGIGQGKELRDFAYQLVKRGFVTLSLGSTPNTQYPSKDNVQLQPLSFHAFEAAVCWHIMARLSYVDATRIGIVGHSYGGKWAMFASCLFDGFAFAAWSDGGIVFDERRGNVNYWEPWYLGYEPGKSRKPGIPSDANPRTGPYKTLLEKGRDLHELHALMAPRPFLVSGGAEDTVERWKPLNHAIAVNKLLGYDNRVAMTNRPKHSPTEESNEQIYTFFELCSQHEKAAQAAKRVKQIIGHRGASAERPENTLASYRRAIEVGATALECDLRTTKDGVLVSAHDADLIRITKTKAEISDLTLEELRRLDAGSWFDPQFASERIPTFLEILQLCKGLIDVLLDLKETGDEYAERVAGEVRKHGDPKRTIVGVRSVEQARLFRKLLPEARQLGLIPTPESLEAFAAAKVEMVRIWPKWLTDATLVPRVRKLGLQLHLNGTTGATEEVRELLRYEPESMSSDDPRQLLRTLSEFAGKKTSMAAPDAGDVAVFKKMLAGAEARIGKPFDAGTRQQMDELAREVSAPSLRVRAQELAASLEATCTRQARIRFLVSEVKRLKGKALTESGGPPWLTQIVGPAAMGVFTRLAEIDLNEHTDGHATKTPRPKGEAVSDDWLKNLTGLTDLVRLEISGTAISDAGLAPLGTLTNLERLNVCLTPITDAGVKHLAPLTNLRRLVICSTKVTGSDFKDIPSWPKIESINLHSCAVSDEGLAAISRFHNLQRLEIVHSKVTDAGLQHLGKLINLRQLHVASPGATRNGLDFVENLNKLYQLDLYEELASNEALTHAGKLTNLKILALYAGPADDAGLASLRSLTNLEELTIGGLAKVTDASVDHLLGLRQLKKLQVNGTRITEAGLQRIRVALPATQILR